MHDPLYALRASLGHAYDSAAFDTEALRTQPDLFAEWSPDAVVDEVSPP